MYIDDRNLFFNRVIHGVIVGLATPVIFFLLYYLFRFGTLPFGTFFNWLLESKKLVNVVSLAVLPNLIPFMLLINSNRYSAGRGVLAVTIVLGVIIFILKFTL